jgi:colicin import membrane protein
MKIFQTLGTLWLTAVPVMAQDISMREQDLARHKASLHQTMDVIELRQQEAARACWQRFAVNDCLIRVRREKRELLEPLRQQMLHLDAAERQLRLDLREKRLQDKEAARD